MLQCRRFYTDKNFKNRIIANSYSLRTLKWSKKNDDPNKTNIIKVPQRNNVNINIKRLNTSNSTEKWAINNEQDDEKIKEKLKQKRELSLKARKCIISRLKNSKDLIEEKEVNEKKEDIRKIEIKFNEQTKIFKRLHSNNDVRTGNNLKKIYEEIENKNLNQSNNNNNFNHNYSCIENYNSKNKTNNTNNVNNKPNLDLLLYKNVRHIYKKNIIRASVLKEKSCIVLNVPKKDESNNIISINENINKKYIASKENISKNSEDSKIHFKEIKKPNIVMNNFRNNNLNIRCNTEENCKVMFNSNKNIKRMTSDYFKKKNIKIEENAPNNINSEVTYNKIDLKKIKTIKNENDKNKRFTYYNYLVTKNKRKTYVDNENNKCSNMSFKLDPYNHKTYINNRFNNISHKINIKMLPSNTKFNSIESEKLKIKKKVIIDKKAFQIIFFENLISIIDSIGDKNIFATSIRKLNEKYFIINNNTYKQEYNTIFIDNENFEYVIKNFCLVLISLIFLSKDDVLYNAYNIQIKNLLIQIIYSSLNYVEMDNCYESNIIYNFSRSNNQQSNISIQRDVLSLIHILFNNRKEYLSLKEALEQIHSIIPKQDFKYILKIINESILFCYNSKPKYTSNIFPLFNFNNNVIKLKTKKSDNTNNNTEKIESIPYIKSPMKKKFCLVLDIDETISHTLKLNFGGYFLLRPGAKYFLEEVSKFYEIIIFTSSQKKYADKILDKIDTNGNIFSHRLYKNHVLYENGKSVKNLNLIGRDLTKTIFIDNLRSNAKYNLDNLCPITTWKSDIFDNRLIKLRDKLSYIATCGKFDDDITQGL